MRNQAEMFEPSGPDFDGADYIPALDKSRLTAQIRRVFDAAVGEDWHTLGDLERITGDPQASISAQLRSLRKARFGGWTVNRRRIRETGTWEYQVVPESGVLHD